MKIDIFAHVMPKRFLAEFSKKYPKVLDSLRMMLVGGDALTNIDVRFRLMDRYPDVLQAITVSLPSLEQFATPKEAIELAKIANDELAEMVNKYPDRFIAAAACLPLGDIDAALEETDRAIKQLGLKGIQIFSRINGELLDNPKFKPLYAKMAKYGLPIWVHPLSQDRVAQRFGLPWEDSVAMYHIVTGEVFQDFPDIKFITHHCGSMVPYFHRRLELLPSSKRTGIIPDSEEYFKKFYVDTALYGNTPALMCGYAYYGADRILFGTDAPLGPKNGLTWETIDAIEQMTISQAEKDKIFVKNAMKILKQGV